MIGVIFGVIVPYIAVAIFVAGVVYRILSWASSPVPLKIPTTGGQQKSFPFIKRTVYDRFDSPYTWWETAGRMLLEIFLFRSLLKNTRYYLDRVSQKDARWLWLLEYCSTTHFCSYSSDIQDSSSSRFRASLNF